MAEQIENTSTFLKNITNYCTDCGEEQDCRKKINTDKEFVAALNSLEQELSDYKGPINPKIIERNTNSYLRLLKENNNFKDICDENSSIEDAVKVRVELLMAYDSSHDIEVAAKKDLEADVFDEFKKIKPLPTSTFYTADMHQNLMLKNKQEEEAPNKPNPMRVERMIGYMKNPLDNLKRSVVGQNQGGKLTLPISLSRFMKKFAKSKRVTKKKRAAKKTKRKVSKKSKKPKSRKQRK